MKVRVPMMVQDPLTSRHENMPAVERVDIDGESFLLDGPVTERLAVLDFDADTGDLLPGATFEAPKPGRVLGGYAVPQDDLYDRRFNQVSVWATVLRSLYMFEEDDALGRPVTWAFGGPQLLIVPRAGRWENAFYERESRSLQFFFFPAGDDRIVYTSLSRDIVAHECTHAILDGVVPDLYEASSPQGLALHEAIADLGAALSAFRSGTLRDAVLERTQGRIDDSTDFSSVADEFGSALDPDAGYLRNLLNHKTLDPRDTSVDALKRPNRVDRDEPHALSEVLSGALYAVMVKLHDAYRRRYAADSGASEFSVSGKALAVAAEQFKRMIVRGLDYLPPGEVSFADYGRAILAADAASHPDHDEARAWLREEFLHRRMARNAAALEVETNVRTAALKALDLETLVSSDWAAYDFANRNRSLLGIPRGVQFHVRPRLDVAKRCYYGQGRVEIVRECIFKVSWDQVEPNRLGPAFPGRRQVTVGTTLVIDWATKVVRSKLTSDASGQQRADRDELLRRLADDGTLRLAPRALAPNGQWLRTVVRAETSGGLMRLRGSGRMLHIAGAGGQS